MKNWKTTLAGCGLAALNVITNGATPKQLAFSVGFAVLGYLCKDKGSELLTPGR